jgi:hypothetical protein
MLLALLASLVSVLSAGERGGISRPLTGNPRIDFFSGGVASLPVRSGAPGMIFRDQEEMAPAEEKSPWIAGALSLAVPGAGEIYSESYVKGAAFMAAEALSWFVAYSYNKKGRTQTVDFENYANQHFSVVRYANWTMDNIGTLSNGTLSRTMYEDQVFNSDYDPDAPCRPPFLCVEWPALNEMERAIGDAAKDIPGGNAYVHALPRYAEQQYYELIGKYEQYSRGWEDADQSPITSSDLPLRNNSEMFRTYSAMRAKANDYYDVAGTFVAVAVINHVVSAFDAYWTATRYNKALHAELKMRLQPTLFGVVPTTEARVRYEF